MKTTRNVLTAIIALTMVNVVALGQIQYGIYEFTGSSTGDNQLNEVVSQPAFATFSAFTRTNVAWNAGADVFNSKDWNTGGTRDDNEYVGFSLTLLGSNTYQDATLTLTFDNRRSDTGPTNGEVMYRFGGDAFASAGTWSPPTTNASTTIIIPAPGNTTSTLLEVHFHAWGASGSTGTLRFDNVALSGVDVPLPIQLASFRSSVVRDNDVGIVWRTISETNNYGFEIERRRVLRGSGDVNPRWVKIAFVEGHGTTLIPQSYSYIDRSVPFGSYSYRIRQIDLDGKSKMFLKWKSALA